MRKRIRFKSLLTDIFFTALCLWTAYYFLRLFWSDLNAYTKRSDKKPVATVSFKRNVAQRKFDDRVVWERIDQNAEVYDGDTISTAEEAEATLYFSDGTQLDLFPNTMVRLALGQDGGVNLSVSGGDIQVDTEQSDGTAQHSIALGDGSKVDLQKGSVVSMATDGKKNGASSIEVKNGNVQVKSASGEEKTLAKGTSVAVAEDGTMVKKALTVLSPQKELKLFALSDDTQTRTVRVAWQTDGDGGTVTVQTSRTKDFSSVLSEKQVSDAENTTLLVSESPLYWRVLGEDRAVAGSGRISVERLSSVRLDAPANETTFRYKTERPNVNLRWTEVPYASQYRLVISSSVDMASPVFEDTLSTPFATFIPKENGAYFWKVTPVLSRADISLPLESAVGQFSLEQTVEVVDVGVVAPPAEPVVEEPPPPPPPVELDIPRLISPANKLVIGNAYLKNNRSIFFSWHDVDEAEHYAFTLSKVEGKRRKVILSSKNIVNSNYMLSDLSVLSEGTFEWAVTALPPSKSESLLASETAVSTFSIRFTAPKAIDAAAAEGVYGN